MPFFVKILRGTAPDIEKPRAVTKWVYHGILL